MVSNPDLFPKENNPFMGFRAIRFCLENPEIFRQQLCAILRASAFGRVKLMYPMISGSEELRRANAVFEECKRELRQRGDKMQSQFPIVRICIWQISLKARWDEGHIVHARGQRVERITSFIS